MDNNDTERKRFWGSDAARLLLLVILGIGGTIFGIASAVTRPDRASYFIPLSVILFGCTVLIAIGFKRAYKIYRKVSRQR